jgi:hypothetical protein
VEFIFVWALLSNHDSHQQLVCILKSAHAYELALLWSRRGSIGVSVMLLLGSDCFVPYMLLLMQIRPHREVDSKIEELQRCLELRYKIDVADLKLGCRLQMGD